MSVLELDTPARTEPHPGPRIRRRRLPGRAWQRWISPLVLVLAWQVASTTGLLPVRLLAAPSTIAATAVDLVQAGTLPTAIAVSLQRVLIGFAAGAIAGVGLALAAGLSRKGENAI